MTGKLKLANVENLISRYQAGESPKKLIGEWGISSQTFYRTLTRHDIARCQLLRNLPDSQIIALYQVGESELALAKWFGVSRNVIRRRILQAGIQPRTGSQANVIRMAKMTVSERKALTIASHQATRGIPKSIESKIKRSRTVESQGLHISFIEHALASMLRGKGIHNFVLQKAIGIYNVDLAIEEPRLAVEVFGGNWHTSQYHISLHNRRIPYILNEGWSMLIIWVNATRYPLSIAAADYIITYLQELSFNKSCGRQYRVIRGNGQPMPFPGYQF